MNYNKIILVGNLTRDPQLSYTPNQTAVADFGIAVNRKWTDQSGSERDEVCFVDCKAFGKRAENINKWCDKGNPLLIEGRLCFQQWKQDDGLKRSKHEVVVENFVFMPTVEKTEGQLYNEPAKQECKAGTRGGTTDEDDIPF